MSETTIELPDGMDFGTAKEVLREFGTTEDAQIVSADALSKKDEQLDELAGVFRDALKSQKGLKDETVEAMPVDALAAEFRNDEGDIEAETLSQNPETQTVSTDSEPSTDSLSASEKKDVEDKLRRAELLESRTPEHADALRSEAADIAGVEDADEIELEAL